MVVSLRTVECFTTPLLWEGMGRHIRTGRKDGLFQITDEAHTSLDLSRQRTIVSQV